MVKKGRDKTDFAEIAERFEDSMNFSNIKSKSDYEEHIRGKVRGNPKAENILPFLDELWNAGKAKGEVEKNSLEIESLKARAIRFERSRGRAGVIDERRTARVTRPLTESNFKSWRDRPMVRRRIDIAGIDTKTGKHNWRSISARRIFISKKDRELQDRRPYIDLKRQVKVYRVSSGRRRGQFASGSS